MNAFRWIAAKILVTKKAFVLRFLSATGETDDYDVDVRLTSRIALPRECAVRKTNL